MLIAALASLALAAPAIAQSGGSVESRLSRIEQVIGGRSLMNMGAEIQRLKQQIRELRGLLEVQQHQLQALRAQVSSPSQSTASTGSPAIPAPVTGVTPATGVTVEPAPPPTTSRQPALSLVDRLSNATRAPASAAAPKPSSGVSRDEQVDYDRAFGLVKTQEFRRAIGAFNDYLARHPDGTYADNAQYWLAESYYAAGETKRALQEFFVLLDSYEATSKRPHALLKIGYIHEDNGRREEAKRAFTELVDRYPGTNSAAMASKRLARMR